MHLLGEERRRPVASAHSPLPVALVPHRVPCACRVWPPWCPHAARGGRGREDAGLGRASFVAARRVEIEQSERRGEPCLPTAGAGLERWGRGEGWPRDPRPPTSSEAHLLRSGHLARAGGQRREVARLRHPLQHHHRILEPPLARPCPARGHAASAAYVHRECEVPICGRVVGGAGGLAAHTRG